MSGYRTRSPSTLLQPAFLLLPTWKWLRQFHLQPVRERVRRSGWRLWKMGQVRAQNLSSRRSRLWGRAPMLSCVQGWGWAGSLVPSVAKERYVYVFDGRVGSGAGQDQGKCWMG